MAVGIYNRAQLRDKVRRNLLQVPPFDIGAGNEGDQPAGSPDPSNIKLNDALNEALRFINKKCSFTANELIQVSLPIFTGTGTVSVDLFSLPSGLVGRGGVNEIRRAYWTDNGGTILPLWPDTRANLDRTRNAYYSQSASLPTRFYIEGTSLYLTPGNSNAGTLTLVAGTSPGPLLSDLDTISQLPVDYQDTIPDCATWLLEGTKTDDAEAQGRSQMFLQKTTDGIAEILAWKGVRQNDEQQASFTFRSYRTPGQQTPRRY